MAFGWEHQVEPWKTVVMVGSLSAEILYASFLMCSSTFYYTEYMSQKRCQSTLPDYLISLCRLKVICVNVVILVLCLFHFLTVDTYSSSFLRGPFTLLTDINM
jgi:hypothetical protein